MKRTIEVSILGTGVNAEYGTTKSLSVAFGSSLSFEWDYIENIPPDLVHDIHYVHTDNNYTTTEKSKLSGIEAGAEVNVLESVKVNGTALPISGKSVNIVTDATPTNGSANPVQSGGVYDALSDKQDTLTFDDVPTAGSDNPVKSGGIKTALDAKQDTISDLAAIRSGAALGATAYQKPVGGIPSTDLSSGVNTSLGKADSAYQKPSGGIPSTDMTSAVQTSLGKADAAYQKPSGGIPSSDMSSAVQTSLGKADTAIQDISGKQDVLVSGTNIKTINNESILGSGNITIQGGGSEDAVLYTEQELTSEQQAQARTNIGAGTSSFSGAYSDLTDAPDPVTSVVYNSREADFEYSLASGQGEVIISRDNLKSVLGMNDKLDSDELYTELGFEEFDSNQTYGEGNCVVYQGDLYMFTSNHSGAWDANDVDEIALTSILQQIIDEISSYFGNGSLFGGIVTPNSQPTYGDDHNYYYLAIEEGSYTYFNNRYVSSFVNLLYWSDSSNSWIQEALWPNSNTLSGWLSNKADKVTGATNGNLAGLDADGNLTDSGYDASDFATASQGTKADNAIPMPSGGSTGQVLKKTASGVEWANESGGGTATDVQVNGTSITSNNVANIVTNTAYNASSNKIATMSDLPSVPVTDVTVGGTSVVSSGTAAIPAIPDVTGKADKVASATNGNFAGLDSNGNLTDSGSKASDFLTSHQDISGKEDKSNKVTSLSSSSTDTQYPSAKVVYDQLATKQATLVSGTNIKTINSTSLLGTGNLALALQSQGISSITTQQDGSIVFTFANGDTTTVDLNHTHPNYYKKTAETTQPSGGMLPDVVYSLGTLTGATTFTFAAAVSGNLNHYYFKFTSGSTAVVPTWPASITSWDGNCVDSTTHLPVIAASKSYEVSVIDGNAIIKEW